MAAQNALRQVAYVAETAYGVTPTTPQTQLIEFVEFDLDPTDAQVSDPSLRPDRQVGYSRRGTKSAEGTLSMVMCPDNADFALEAVTGGTFTANVLKIGNTKRSFAIEEGFTDIAQYRTFNGVMFNTMSMEVKPDNELVTASFGLMAAGASAFVGTSIDSTPTAIVSKDKFFHEGGTIQEGGSAVAYITAIKFDLTNNLGGDYALGNTSYRSMSLGQFKLTGALTALFESPTLYNKYFNSTDSTISHTLAAGAESLTFAFPKVKYTSAKVIRAASGSVLCELGFEAVYDTTSASSLVITRV